MGIPDMPKVKGIPSLVHNSDACPDEWPKGREKRVRTEKKAAHLMLNVTENWKRKLNATKMTCFETFFYTKQLLRCYIYENKSTNCE